MKIVSFSPDRGHCVHIPSADLVRFRTHVAHMSAAEREEYGPLSLSAEQPTDGGAYYFIGLHQTHGDSPTITRPRAPDYHLPMQRSNR